MVARDMWNSEDSERFMPCVERGPTLFFYDQGVLAAFDVVTGNARWRLPSVGVTSLKFDDKGMMYVITTSAQQQDIKYIDQVDVTRKTVPVMMKVDPKNGKIIWSLNQTGETCLFSGKYFYAIEASTGGGTRFGRDVPAHTRIYRLHPRDGRVIWDHLEKKFPVDIDFRGNTILALFPDELKVLKFMAL
jgi:outer membrane protein assembly factor BamB